MHNGKQRELDQDFWNQRYLQGLTGWDAGSITTPMKAYIDQLNCPDARILIPGGGNSYEASYLLAKNYKNITVVDIASALRPRLEAKFSAFPRQHWQILITDFFNLDAEAYDLILEQTFFCALDPVLRSAYVEKMCDLLKPGGKLVGVLFDRQFDGGPPFGGHKQEYLQLFESRFIIQVLDRCFNSIPPRNGSEVFMILQKPTS